VLRKVSRLGFAFVSALGGLAVSLGTADLLAYLVFVLVIGFLISASLVIYIFYKRRRGEDAGASPEPMSSSSA
jgi:hypothetical protein